MSSCTCVAYCEYGKWTGALRSKCSKKKCFVDFGCLRAPAYGRHEGPRVSYTYRSSLPSTIQYSKLETASPSMFFFLHLSLFPLSFRIYTHIPSLSPSPLSSVREGGGGYVLSASSVCARVKYLDSVGFVSSPSSTLLLLVRVESTGLEGGLHRPSLVDVHDHDLGAGVVLPRVDDPPGCGQDEDADENDAVVVHGFCCRGDAVCCCYNKSSVSILVSPPTPYDRWRGEGG